MRIAVTEPSGELGRVVARVARERRHEVVEPGAAADSMLVLAAQRPNTLLHDGHRWKRQAQFLPQRAIEAVRALRQGGTGHVVVASSAFLWNAPSDPDFLAAADVEKAIAGTGLPTGVVRLGWLYGPRLHDMEMYRRSWVARRPYYAGPGRHLQSFVHHDDAAAALVAAAERSFEGAVDAVDAEPVSFGRFMDTFARLLGFRPGPLHIPKLAARALPALIDPHQVAALDVASARTPGAAERALGWEPAFPTYREGLAGSAAAMNAQRRRPAPA